MTAPSTLRTLWLTERLPALCRLTRADIATLLDSHRGQFQVLPGGRPGTYQLLPRGVAGTVVLPGCRLVVRPKIPLRNLFFMLDPNAPPTALDDTTSRVPGTEAFHFLVACLVRRLQEIASTGLHRGYAERADQFRTPHGKIDLPARLREAARHQPDFPCHFDDFTIDVPINQIARGTADQLLASPLLAAPLRDALRRAVAPFADVTPGPLTAEAFASAVCPDAYRPLLDLCRLLVDGLAPGESAGSSIGPSFFLDLERTFEAYLTRAMIDGLADGPRTLWPQREQMAAEAPGQPPVVMRPDITIERDGRPLLVVDAKWKRWPPAVTVTDDLYQVLSYGVGLGVSRAWLVYPGRRDRDWDYTFGRMHVGLRSVRVVGSQAACQRSLQRLLKEVRRL
jgi:5-methylcytosine-specific restriction enzyme subunit McrC